MASEEQIDVIMRIIGHGDAAHQAWLRDKADAVIDAVTTPLTEALEKAREVLTKGAFSCKCAPDFRLECEQALTEINRALRGK